MTKVRTRSEVGELIIRFLENRSFYPQEWNDFVECSQSNRDLEQFRKRCYELDPLVNCPSPQDQAALEELRLMAELLAGRPVKFGA